jgi:hypothetical membrane protein
MTMKQKPFSIAVAYFIAVIFLAHLVPPPGYRWTQNTISDLASQGHVYKWIMQLGLSGFGGLILFAVWQTCINARRMIFHLIPIALYGLAIFLSGLFCTAPIDASLSYSEGESTLHSLFATIAGLALSMAILWRIFNSATSSERWIHLICLVAVIGLSMLFGLAENHVIELGKGIVQRLLYVSGFVWLVY